MSNLHDLIMNMPEMKQGQELISSLSVLPEYNEKIRDENQAIRLIALSAIHRIYIPSEMSIEIYSKMYLALLKSLQKKETNIAVKQRYENYKAIQQQSYSGILGGSDSFTIIGTSGIGKSSAINRAISLITENRIIETDKPYTKIIPCLIVQCPFDSSVKGMLFEILRKVDETLGSNYYQYALKARATTDMLIGSVAQVALNHIGMLVVDEIQNVVNSKNGKSLIGALTQLINNSGISEDGKMYVQVSTGQDIPTKVKSTLEKIRDSKSDELKSIEQLFFFVLANSSESKVMDFSGKERIGRINFIKSKNLITTENIVQKAKTDIEFSTKFYI